MVGNLYFESIIEALYKKKYKLLLTISNRKDRKEYPDLLRCKARTV